MPQDPLGHHAYPRQLARLVTSRWAEVDHWSPTRTVRGADARVGSELPTCSVVEQLLSVCYQASLLREEVRPVTFRLALGHPDIFAPAAGPPAGLHRLVLEPWRPLDEHELRRVAPATPFHRSLVGANFDPKTGLRIWGLIHSGPGWLRSVRGGRDVEQIVPAVPIIAVTGPGRLLVSKGTHSVAELSGGTLATAAMDVFRASWLSKHFHEVEDVQTHRARARAGDEAASLDPTFGRLLVQHALRRIVATIRASHHGGTLILLPSAHARRVLKDDRLIALKYAIRDEEPRRRLVSLTAQILDEVLRLHRGSRPGSCVGWADYERSHEPSLAAMDEALFEAAHLVGGLAQVDGAVVMTNQLELLGFGGEISGALPEISSVARALDLEGTHWAAVSTDRDGTRHRSAFRFCQERHDALAIVLSQDGGLRFVRWHDGRVTYWNQIATGPWEV